jgi:hypothetical protein
LEFRASNFGFEGANKPGFGRQEYVKFFQKVVDVYIVGIVAGKKTGRTSCDHNELAESDGAGTVFAYI